MQQTLLKQLLDQYHPTDLTEQNALEKMYQFLQSEENCFERSCLEGHFTGSCWLENFDGSAGLLTLHKKLSRWLTLGGHADGDHDLLRVALKEAKEESGLLNIVPVSSNIFDIGVCYVPQYQDVPPHYHYDVRFYLKALDDEPFIVSDESNALLWVRRDEADKIPDEENVQRMYKKWLMWKK